MRRVVLLWNNVSWRCWRFSRLSKQRILLVSISIEQFWQQRINFRTKLELPATSHNFSKSLSVSLIKCKHHWRRWKQFTLTTSLLSSTNVLMSTVVLRIIWSSAFSSCFLSCITDSSVSNSNSNTNSNSSIQYKQPETTGMQHPRLQCRTFLILGEFKFSQPLLA